MDDDQDSKGHANNFREQIVNAAIPGPQNYVELDGYLARIVDNPGLITFEDGKMLMFRSAIPGSRGPFSPDAGALVSAHLRLFLNEVASFDFCHMSEGEYHVSMHFLQCF